MKIKSSQSHLWETVRRLMRSEGLNADDMSVDRIQMALGLSRGTTQRIMEGHENITRKTLAKIAERFQVPESLLAEGAAGHLSEVDPRLKSAWEKARAAADAVDREGLSTMAVHLASMLDSIKDQDKRTKAFADAVVALQPHISHLSDVDKAGQ